MKPLSQLTDAEIARFGEMELEDFAREGVPEWLAPYVFRVAQTLLEALLCRKNLEFHKANRLEATALGDQASWGRRGDGCAPLVYLVRNVLKAVVRENKSARTRPARPRDKLRTEEYELIESILRGDPLPYGLDHPDLQAEITQEPRETVDEYIARLKKVAPRLLALARRRRSA